MPGEIAVCELDDVGEKVYLFAHSEHLTEEESQSLIDALGSQIREAGVVLTTGVDLLPEGTVTVSELTEAEYDRLMEGEK